MNSFWTWFAKSPVASALRVFVAVVLSQMVADWARVGDFDFSNYKLWLISALVASVPTILRWINPEDKAFGSNKVDSQAAVVANRRRQRPSLPPARRRKIEEMSIAMAT